MPIDEGPSAEDIRRFSDQTAYCPSCGEEVWDEAPRCPACGRWLSGNTQSRHPVADTVRRKLFAVVAIVLVVLLSGIVVLLRVL